MAKKVQEQYLLQALDSCAPVAVYLMNGIKLSGVIAQMDDEVIVLNDNNGTVSQLIYKHAISTIVPKRS